MDHIPFEQLCSIADGEMTEPELGLLREHLDACPSCQREIELQKSIIKIYRQSKLINPSTNFNRKVMETANPGKKKDWLNQLLQNMGNLIVMVLVLGFLGYIYSLTSAGTSTQTQSSNIEEIGKILSFIRDINHQCISYITRQVPDSQNNALNGQTGLSVVLAIIVLGLIDRIILFFIQKSSV